MTLEQIFIRGCYYYAVGNPIWHVHHGAIVKAANEINLVATMKAVLVEEAAAHAGLPVAV